MSYMINQLFLAPSVLASAMIQGLKRDRGSSEVPGHNTGYKQSRSKVHTLVRRRRNMC